MIPVRKIYLSLILIIFCFLIMNFISYKCSAETRNLFDLDKEANLPTWFSSILLFSIAFASMLIYFLGRRTDKKSSWKNFWPGFSILFCFLSLDEAVGFNELISSTYNFNWIWFYAPLGGLFFIVVAYFFEYINKNKDLTNHILGGITIYALGILTSEILNSYPEFFIIKTAIEEGLEMFGALFILTGSLQEVNRLMIN